LISLKAAYIYIVVPNFSRPELKFFPKTDMLLHIPFHLWHFDRPSLVNLINFSGASVVSTGYDTIPTFGHNLVRFMAYRKYPEIITKCISSRVTNCLLMPANIFFPNNVLWAIIKI